MDLTRYLERICLERPPAANAEGLALVQSAHRMAIGFENLDVQLGRRIQIDAASVFDKLVVRQRGGYCFEQNRLFSDALTALGLSNRPVLARVRLNLAEGVTPPRTHVGLLVTIDGQPWLADAGFGGSNVPPLPLLSGVEATTSDGARHRLVDLGGIGTLHGAWRLERAGPSAATDGRAADHGEWQPQYTFDLDQVAPDDLELSNHWASTRPDTRFTAHCVVSIVLQDGFASMIDRSLTTHRAGKTESRLIDHAADYVRTLNEVFRIDLSIDEVRQLPLF